MTTFGPPKPKKHGHHGGDKGQKGDGGTGNGSKGGNGNPGGHGGGHKKSKFADLLDPTEARSGKQMLQLAKAMARLQTRPQVKAYQRLANEIRGQSTADTSALSRLGRESAQASGAAYRGLDAGMQGGTARSAALGSMLNTEIGGNIQQAGQQQRAVQGAVVGGLDESMALRGAPGGGMAQQQLQALVQAQAGRMGAEGLANSNAAAAQGGIYAQLNEGMRGAAGMQGARAQSDIRSTIASRIAEGKLSAGQDIREALGRKADAKASKGDLIATELGELTDRERDYLLSLSAIKADKQSARLAAASDAADRAAEAALQDDEQAHEAALQDDEQKDGGSDDGKANKGKNKGATKKAYKSAYNFAGIIARGANMNDPQALRQNLADFIDKIVDRADVDPKIARRAALAYIKSLR